MKTSQAKAIFQDCKDRGYIEQNGILYPPSQAALLGFEPKKKSRGKTLIKSGDVHDERNIRNKEKQRDAFIMLMEMEGLECWPEFYFTTERNYRLDYAILITLNSGVLKIGVEVSGGIWSKGNSGHSSGKGIKRDQQKASLAASLGWLMITVEPNELMSSRTLELIKNAIENRI